MPWSVFGVGVDQGQLVAAGMNRLAVNALPVARGTKLSCETAQGKLVVLETSPPVLPKVSVEAP